MNDRFKFRVWDKKNSEYVPEGKMCDVHCLLHRDGTLDCGVAYDDGYAGGIDWVNIEDAIIEQCTGAKDKNGKLIFEGDVVIGSWNTKLVVIWDEVSIEYRVKPLDGGGDREFHYFSSSRYLDDGAISYCHFEIIGNVHEMEVEK